MDIKSWFFIFFFQNFAQIIIVLLYNSISKQKKIINKEKKRLFAYIGVKIEKIMTSKNFLYYHFILDKFCFIIIFINCIFLFDLFLHDKISFIYNNYFPKISLVGFGFSYKVKPVIIWPQISIDIGFLIYIIWSCHFKCRWFITKIFWSVRTKN